MMKPFPWGVFWPENICSWLLSFSPPLFFGPPSPVQIHLAVENQVQVRERIHKMVQKTEQRGFTATLAQMETWAASRGRIFSPPPAAGGKAMSIRDMRLLIVGWSPWYNAATLQGYPCISIVALSYVLFSDGSSFSGNLLELTNAWSKPDMTEICFEREDFVHHCTWRRLSFVHMNMNIIEIYACISYIIYLSHTWNAFIWYTNIERRPFFVCTLCGLVADVDCNHSKVHGQHWVSHRKKLALAPWAFWIHPQMGMKLYFYS